MMFLPRYFSMGAKSHQTTDTPRIMGVLNVTPDSFSDGGRFSRVDPAYDHAMLMLADGADMIDIGGESTRPGAAEVCEQEELDRVIPVIERITAESEAFISIDTRKSAVMREAVAAGASMINDVQGLSDKSALQFAAQSGLPVCIMHMQGSPKTMQESPSYDSVVDEVLCFLRQRIEAFVQAGGHHEHVIVDPGFGFGKSLQHNLALFAKLDELHQLQAPILVGVSRKSMFGQLLGLEVDDRLTASVVGATLLADRGAAIVRVHDVAETRDAIKFWQAIKLAEKS